MANSRRGTVSYTIDNSIVFISLSAILAPDLSFKVNDKQNFTFKKEENNNNLLELSSKTKRRSFLASARQEPLANFPSILVFETKLHELLPSYKMMDGILKSLLSHGFHKTSKDTISLLACIYSLPRIPRRIKLRRFRQFL